MYLTHKEALKLAFPGHTVVEKRHVFLTPEQVTAIEERVGGGVKVTSKLLTYYRGVVEGATVRYAVFDAHVVRSKSETCMVVMGADGSLKFVEILTFDEPEEYAPPRAWLEEFRGKKLDGSLHVRRGLSNVAGATLTALALTDGVRRILAAFPEIQRSEAKRSESPSPPKR